MKDLFSHRVSESARLIAQLNEGSLPARIESAISILTGALKVRNPVLVCGNGGSASDAMHISGELVGRFLRERPAYNVLALSVNTSVLTAWSNDYTYETVFSRQVEAHGHAGGVLWGISTSGNSPNVLRALAAAREMGMKTIGLTGAGGGKMAPLCDVLLDVPSRETPRIQEMHVVLYHFMCEQVESVLAV
ncbi:MAG: D-sedoheptulose 7-phosphate isomerase [Betaproteobacteria bacterium]|nr:D-sedoheptulose 7-phosphate isomerase [Betaproteobacteria bacterium]